MTIVRLFVACVLLVCPASAQPQSLQVTASHATASPRPVPCACRRPNARRQRPRRCRPGRQAPRHLAGSGRSSPTKASRRRRRPKCGSSSRATRSTSAWSATTAIPSSIIVSDSRRDAGLDDTDSFQIIFDTYRDRQNGFVFGTNPAAIEYDGQVTNEGQGGGGLGGGQRQQSGSGSGFNLNWDAAWEVRTQIDERGWSAEFAIPFRTLRFPVGRRSDLGRQLPAQHPPPQRARVLGADSAAVQPVSPVAGRHGRGHPDADDPQLQGDAVRARQHRRVGRAAGRFGRARRRRRRRQVQR